MTRRLLLASLVLVAACRDPGRDVQPMADPLRSDDTSATETEIIPREDVRKSQAAAVSQRVANTEITVRYSRPVARGRELFGVLVPYGEIWNPGADQATSVSFTRDVQVDGRPLPAGTYSIWVIPDPTRWTVVLSRAGEVYHTPYPGEDLDAMRLEVAPEPGPYAEALTFEFPSVEGKGTVLRLHWGEVMVPLSIAVP